MSILQEKDKEYIAGTYARFPVALVEGSGSRAKDEDGREYIDLGSGIAVTAFGFADAEWQKAVSAQAAKLQHTSNLYYTEPCVSLAEMLCQKTGMKKVFFGNSGAEANECAIKLARKYAADKKGADTYTIVTLKNGFHGRTLTTLAATGQEHYHELFQPLTPGFVHAEPGDLADMARLFDEYKVAGVLLECVQGEGGVNVLDRDFVMGVAALCEKHDALLMIDEVQTGNGRTGTLYAYMQYGISPDVVTTAKGLGGGLPIGACLLGERVKDVLGAGSHGSTFGGNPIAAAGACHVLSRIDGSMLASVREKSAYIVEELSGAEGVKSVSGMGLMLGIETEKPIGEVMDALFAHGVIALKAKNKLRLLPPLTIKADELRRAVSVIKAALKP